MNKYLQLFSKAGYYFTDILYTFDQSLSELEIPFRIVIAFFDFPGSD